MQLLMNYLFLSHSYKNFQVFTKREILQTIADPLGYFAPSILEAKFFMRELWEDEYS